MAALSLRPASAIDGGQPFHIDSKPPSILLEDYICAETRYRMLPQSKGWRCTRGPGRTPVVQQRLAHYTQLYSRVGFVHQFPALSGQELRGVVEPQWLQLGVGLSLDASADTDDSRS